MQAEKRTFSGQVPDLKPEAWPGPTILLSAPFPAQRRPRAWRVDLSGADFSVNEILTVPFVQLEGAYDDVFSLLYGFRPELMDGPFGKLGLDPGKGPETVGEIRNKLPAPVDKLNLAAMPTQDAMDLGYFLASVQVQMDRFLPGTPACGGPIVPGSHRITARIFTILPPLVPRPTAHKRLKWGCPMKKSSEILLHFQAQEARRRELLLKGEIRLAPQPDPEKAAQERKSLIEAATKPSSADSEQHE
jgi:hypothetical protein